MLPVLVVILIGIMDFGRVFFTAIAVTHATRVGAEYGAQGPLKPYDTAGMQSAAATAAADINGFSATGYAPGSAGNPCKCFDAATNTESAMANCSSTCSGSVRVYSRLDGTVTFNTISRYPGLPHTLTISRTAWIRAQ